MSRGRAPLAWLTALLVCSACASASPKNGERVVEARPSASAVSAAASSATSPTAEPLADTSAPSPTSPPLPPFASTKPVDLWIKGGTVVDGTGVAARAADVVVRGDRIVWVGPVAPGLVAKTTIDATGKLVTPGFVDAHSHDDPFANGRVALAQGITTVLIGQDGKSAERVGVLYDKVDREHTRMNVATLFGHATARVQARLPTRRAPNDDELTNLSNKVAIAMEEGAFGLSTGLEYEPGSLANADELAAAARPVGERGGLVMSHLRSEDDDKIMASLDELFEQCRRSGARAHVSHIKIVLGKGEARARAVLARLERARASGLLVTADLYPYTASYTTTAILFPPWAKPPASFSEAKRERRDELLKALRDRINQRGGPEKMLFGTGNLAGMTLAEVAAQTRVPFEQVLFDQGPGAASAAYFVMDDAVVRTFFADPHVMIGTDGGGGLHPRNAGTFAKILGGYVRDDKLVGLEEGIRKMSALPMKTLGVTDRGTLRAGAGADILVFELAAIHDRATFTAPFLASEGMSTVIVGGAIEWQDGKPTSAKGGRALRRGQSSVRTRE